MCLLYLIKQDYAVRLSPDTFAELSSFFESDISRRRSYQSGYIEFLHVFAHVQTDDIVL